MRNPTSGIAIRLLGKHKIDRFMTRQVPLLWTSTIDLPIPQGENKDIGAPDQSRVSQ